MIIRKPAALHRSVGCEGSGLEVNDARLRARAILKRCRSADDFGVVDGIRVDEDTVIVAPLEIFLRKAVRQHEDAVKAQAIDLRFCRPYPFGGFTDAGLVSDQVDGGIAGSLQDHIMGDHGYRYRGPPDNRREPETGDDHFPERVVNAMKGGRIGYMAVQ